LAEPRPIVKWAGGKRQMIGLLLEKVPAIFGTYFEPFVGGGSLLFALRPQRAVISDINSELMNAYLVVRDDPDALIRSLQRHRNEPEHFSRIRAYDPSKLTTVQRASRFIFLNKTCYNGLYRENGSGQFNAPFGRYENPTIVDKANIAAVSEYLRHAEVRILNVSYEKCLQRARGGDFAYLDPPYFPLSTTASFTKYHRTDFTADDQKRLAGVFRKLDGRGCYLLLSNSNMPFVRQLYAGYRIQEVSATRFINCKADRRGKAPNELIISNY